LKFRSKVTVLTDVGRVQRSIHAAHAIRLCESGQAKRVSSGEIRLVVEAPAYNDQVRDVRVSDTFKSCSPIRRNTGGHHSSPNFDRKTIPQAWYGAHSGQIGSVRRVFIRNSEAA
jgi:hypothetical protein